MEDFTITISSADIMYYSAFMTVSLAICLVVLCLLYYVCAKVREHREEKKERRKKIEANNDLLLRLVNQNDIGIRALHKHIHGKNKDAYDVSFVEAVDEEMRRRGLM